MPGSRGEVTRRKIDSRLSRGATDPDNREDRGGPSRFDLWSTIVTKLKGAAVQDSDKKGLSGRRVNATVAGAAAVHKGNRNRC